MNEFDEFNKSKTSIGAAFAIFLGLFGLLLGLLLYPAGTFSRKTFIKGWLTMFIMLIGIIIFVIVIVFISRAIITMYN